MKRRFSALLLALALLPACLTGCGNKAADAFYDLSDEIAQIQDAEVELILPYHGAELQITGFISRTSETADLTFALSGTEGRDGPWSELRIDGNQIWLNVDQLAQRTLDFDLPAVRKEDILEFRQNQIAPWVTYIWEGDLWNGIPEWEELLTGLWQDSRSDLEPYIKADGTEQTLILKGKSLEQVSDNIVARLTEHADAYRESFVDTIGRQNGLVMAAQMEPGAFFDSYWLELTAADRDSAASSLSVAELIDPELAETEAVPAREPLESVTVSLSKEEDSYTVSLTVNDGAAARLTLTPTQPQTVTAPEDVMEFRAYMEYVYYLITFSDNYVGDALDGVSYEDTSPHKVEEDAEELLYPLATGAALGYDDLATVQFATQGGNFSTVPILTGYTENEVESVNDDGVQVLGLSLNGSGWSQHVSSEPADQSLIEYLSDIGYRYYDVYINVTGCMLVQDLSDLVQSADGTAAAQGFSYREHEYAPTFARLLIVLEQPDGAGYTVLNLDLNLSELSNADRDMVSHLFAYLGLEVPISLEA